jgi:glutamyl endopeptidase
MNSQLISILREVLRLAELANSDGDVNDTRVPVSEPVPQGLLEPPTSASSPSDPLHVLISRPDTVESAWEYAKDISEGYPGDDGGHLSDATRRLLKVDGPETVIDSDDRTRVLNTDEYPWRMITALEISTPDERTLHGTGFMVGPTTIFTAGHCVYDTRMGGWAKAVTARPGLSGETEPYGSHPTSRLCTVVGWVDLGDPRYDYGILELDQPIGRKTGWFSVAVLPNSQLHNRVINACGYSVDRNPTNQWHSAGRIGHLESQRLYHNCDTFGGNSGGPIWICTRDGSQTIAAIHAYGVGGSANDGMNLNSGTRIVPEIRKAVPRKESADTDRPFQTGFELRSR